MTVRVASLSPYPESVVRDLFAGRDVEIGVAPTPASPAAVLELVAGADLVLGDRRHQNRVGRDVLERMDSCRLYQQPSVGFDVIDHRAAAELGIPVANAAGYNRDAVADWVIMAVLTLLRQGSWSDHRMRQGEWPYSRMRGRELGAQTVGIVGAGNTGNAVASRLRAFGCRLLVTDSVPRSVAGAEVMALDGLLEQADVVTVHVPLDLETRALIGEAALARMKPGAILINASRGPVVDEAALVRALASGHLGGAGLDVFEQEPVDPGSPLLAFENVFVTPHIGGLTDQADQRLLELCAANLTRVLDGALPFNIVNGVSRRA